MYITHLTQKLNIKITQAITKLNINRTNINHSIILNLFNKHPYSRTSNGQPDPRSLTKTQMNLPFPYPETLKSTSSFTSSFVVEGDGGRELSERGERAGEELSEGGGV